MGRITINDVAERAGVSKTITSFVLNDVSGRYSKESKEKVMAAVKELGYVPNKNAKNLRSNKANTIMLVYSKEYLKEQNASTTQFIIEIIKYAERLELEIIIKTTRDWKNVDEAVAEYSAIWNAGQTDGIIFMPAYGEMDDEVFVRLYQDCAVNIAVISTIGGGKKYPTVYMDGYSQMQKALEYITGKGYATIYYVSLKYTDKSHMRLKAYADYLKQGKTKGGFLEYKDEYRNKEELWSLISPILTNQQENIAFACWNDVDAINILELLNMYKLKANYKIGVMGFDDMRLGAHTVPALTTVHYPFDEAAKKALSILQMNEIKPDLPPSYIIYGTIIERDSV